MQIVIDIDENVFTRLFDNGIEDYAIMNDDLFKIAQSIRKCTPLPKGHGRLKDIDKFLKKVEEDRMHECYMRSWTIDDVLQRLDSRYTPTIIEADKESEV